MSVVLFPVLPYSAQMMVMITLINVLCFIRSSNSQNFRGISLSVEKVKRPLTVCEISLARYESET